MQPSLPGTTTPSILGAYLSHRTIILYFLYAILSMTIKATSEENSFFLITSGFNTMNGRVDFQHII